MRTGRFHLVARWACLSLAAVTALAVAGARTPAFAGGTATLYVDGTNGTNTSGCTSPGAGACETIQEGITAAEQGSYAGDTITIEVAAGTYSETDYLQDSGEDVVIQGAGASTTIIDADGGGPVFQDTSSSTGTLSGLTLTQGDNSGGYGGGVENYGTLTLTDDTISHSYASQDGGGVYDEFGTLTMTDDTVDDNTGGNPASGRGGGIYIYAANPTTLTNVTVFDNTGGYDGGGLDLDGAGAVTVNESTFSGNSAGTAGAGIFSLGTVSIANSIIDGDGCNTALTDGGYNVESDATCATGADSTDNSPDIDLAGSLAANGSSGPETLAIDSGSSAFEEVPTADCTVSTDERGDPRPGISGQNCDAGAFELQPTSTVTTLSASSNVRGEELTATVSPTPDGGTVTFTDGTTTFCTRNVSTTTGQATCFPSYSGPGNDSVYAVYSGDAAFGTSTSNSVVLTPAAATSTTTSVSSSADPAAVDTNVTYTATVSPVPDGGTMDFTDSLNDLSGCSAVPVDTTTGQASCSQTYTGNETDDVTADYSGDTDYASSSGSTTETIGTGGSTTPITPSGSASTTYQVTVQVSSASVVFGQSLTVYGTVSPAPGGGDVTVSGIPGCGTLPVGSSGAFSCITKAPAASGSPYSLTASFTADGQTATSSPVKLTVAPAGTSTSLAAAPSSAPAGSTITFTATVTPASPAGATAPDGGTVRFTSPGGTLVYCGPTAVDLATGQASCAETEATAQAIDVVATYSGDGNYSGSTSAPMTGTYTKPPATGSPTTPAPTTPTSTTCASEAGQPQADFVCALYSILLNRAPDSSDLSFWESQLNHGASHMTVALDVLTSLEYHSDLVDAWYHYYLNRAPDSAGLSTLTSDLAAGQSPETVQAGMLGSTEFYGLAGSTDAGFLSTLYQDVLGRPVDQPGLAHWETALAQGTSRTQVADDVLTSPEYYTDLLETWYRAYLDRPGDSSGLAGFTTELTGGASDQSVQAAMLGSAEFISDHS